MITAPLTPPAGPSSPEPPTASRPAAKVVAILLIALGSVAVAGTAVGSVVPTVASSLTHSQTSTLAVEGVQRLRLDAGAARLSIRFDDVDEASLEVRDGGHGEWRLDREGDELRVQSPEGSLWSWLGSDEGDVELVLPDELAGLDADLDFGAGSLDAEGRFGVLDLELGVGEANLTGSADEVSVTLGVGQAEFDLSGVRSAHLDVNAGSLIGRITGSAPAEVALSVSVGSVELALPDEAYAVSSDVSAGNLDNGLRVAESSSHTVSVEIAAGEATLRAE